MRLSNRYKYGDWSGDRGSTECRDGVLRRGQDYGGAIVGCGKRALTYRASDDAGVEPALSQAKQAPAVAISHAEAVASSELLQPYRCVPAANLPQLRRCRWPIPLQTWGR
jgi:hypothetical protein